MEQVIDLRRQRWDSDTNGWDGGAVKGGNGNKWERGPYWKASAASLEGALRSTVNMHSGVGDGFGNGGAEEGGNGNKWEWGPY